MSDVPSASPDAAAALARGLAEQRAALERALSSGMPRAGWKIGLNVPEVQQRLGLGGSLVGWIDGRRVVATGSRYEVRPGTRLHVEAELALRLGAPVRAGAPAEEARRAIREVAPALELVDYALPRSDLEAIVSHSMFHAGTVLGPPSPAAEALLDPAHPRVLVGGELRAAPQAGWVPADLGAAVSLVARRLAEIGHALQAGDLVLSGSYTRPLPLAAGDTVVADFGALGAVSVTLDA